MSDVVFGFNGFIHSSMIDGPGYRLTIFVQGCPFNCKGCFNQEMLRYDVRNSDGIIDILMNRRIVRQSITERDQYDGLTLSGGEPFLYPLACAILAEEAHVCNWDVWTYTGYLYEDLVQMAETDENVDRLLKATDVLVDGPFIEELKDDTLKHRSCTNERIIKLENGRWKELLNFDEE